MTDGDCGRLCAPRNRGVPFCCDLRRVAPILYRDELRFQRRESPGFWRPRRPRGARERRCIAGMAAFLAAADCPGPGGCRRRLRALVCRAFPFEPHLGDDGTVLGLTYQYEHEKHCPLIGLPRTAFRPAYIRGALTFWREILDIFPEERDLYLRASRRLRQRFWRQGRTIRVFR